MDDYALSTINSEKEWEEYLQLLRTVFGEHEGVDNIVKRLKENHPKFTWNNIFIVKHKEKIVATLNLIPQTWSINDISIKVAEMGMVATLPEYRKLGIQRLLNKEYDKKIFKENYDLSAIEGIPYFYRQFGYEYTLPLDVETRISLNKIPDYKEEFQIRQFQEKDILKASKLLQKTQKKYLIHSIRDNDIWKMQYKTGWQADWPFEGYVVEDQRETIAYFRISIKENKLFLIEISETNQPVAESILGFLKKHAKKHGLTEIISRISNDEPFSNTLKTLGAEPNRPYAWQIKVIDHLSLLKKMQPLLELRLEASEYRNLSDKIKINLYKKCIQLDIKEGKLNQTLLCEGLRSDEIRINYDVFPQLLSGTKKIEELCTIYKDVSVTPKYLKLIDTLFPNGVSFINACY
ncbi:GNAT family N-acetyltransferase [Candidatus Bathyarchaeota archaeon]|nr:GNAT family N-acetyltransferase [Candidatus Bathyarchaeota archaeon]